MESRCTNASSHDAKRARGSCSCPQHRQGSKGGSAREDRILISEVDVVGCDGELRRIAREALTTRPNFAYTLDEVKADVRRVFATGWFSEVDPDAEDTRDGVKLIIRVKPNEEVRSLSATGASLLPANVIQQAFEGMPGRTLNLGSLQRAVSQLHAWYQQRGIMGMVSDYTFEDGQLQLRCAEAVVGSVQLRFLDPATNSPKDKTRTKPHIITRHLATKPGQVYSMRTVRRDINAVYSTGLLDDVNLSTREAEDSTETAPRHPVCSYWCRGPGGPGAGSAGAQDGRPQRRRRHQRSRHGRGCVAGPDRLLVLQRAQPVRPQSEADHVCGDRAGGQAVPHPAQRPVGQQRPAPHHPHHQHHEQPDVGPCHSREG